MKIQDDEYTMNSGDVAGAVILFHPSDTVVENILSYINQVHCLYVVDNSVQRNNKIVSQLEKLVNVKYVGSGINLGIAKALNIAAEFALSDGYQFLLTMDQDTAVPPHFVSTLLRGIRDSSEDAVGIMAPAYRGAVRGIKAKYQAVLFTMTSGNILNLHVYRMAGAFIDELFIDHVDHEYCLRLNSLGYSVIQNNDLILMHRPGTVKSFAGLRLVTHSPERSYYFCRNGFYVCKLYWRRFPKFTIVFLNRIVKEILKVILEDQKILRIKLIAKGYIDYKKNRLGPLDTRK